MVERKDLGRGVANREIHCPFCGHQLLPPDRPFCQHAVYIHIESPFGVAGFEYVAPWFAPRYLDELQRSGYLDQTDTILSDRAKEQFVNGHLPKPEQQEIPLWRSDNLFPDDASVTVFSVEVEDRFGSTAVEVAVQQFPDS